MDSFLIRLNDIKYLDATITNSLVLIWIFSFHQGCHFESAERVEERRGEQGGRGGDQQVCGRGGEQGFSGRGGEEERRVVKDGQEGTQEAKART